MSGGAMAWWYWFGMWVGGISSLVLTWWVGVDASRRSGSASKFGWAFAAAAGCVLQMPAFFISAASRSAEPGSLAAFAGVFGVVVVGISIVTHFTGSPAGASVWSLGTKDIGSSTYGPPTQDRKRSKARASVPLPGARPSATPKASGDLASVASLGSILSAPPAEGLPDQDSPLPTIVREVTPTPAECAADSPDGSMPDLTVVDDAATSEGVATFLAEPQGAAPEPLAGTIDMSADGTVTDDVDATVLDEPALTVLQDGDGLQAQLVITGGRSSRIVITDRSGPFKVGRDPSKVNLAVDDGRVSRVHFVIDRMSESYVLTDGGSANGTFVNGSPVLEPTELHAGDSVEFGRTIATFVIAGSTE